MVVRREQHLRPCLLRDDCDVRPDRLRVLEDVVAEDEGSTERRSELGREDPQERRLPRAVAAEQTEDLPLLDGEGDALEGLRPAGVRFPEPFDADDLHEARPTGPRYLRILRVVARQAPPERRRRRLFSRAKVAPTPA